MKRSTKTRNMAYFALFIAIELVLTMTPLGYIRTPMLSITLMHIPVIVCGAILGPAYGAGLGLLFGLTSVYNATTAPTAASFVFSPFITVGGISGNWSSLIIALVPRILLGAIAGWLFNAFRRKMKPGMAGLFSGVIATLCHTLMVLSLIYFLWGEQYAAALGSSYALLFGLLATTVVTNGLMEAAAAGLINMGVCRAMASQLKPVKKADAKAGKVHSEAKVITSDQNESEKTETEKVETEKAETKDGESQIHTEAPAAEAEKTEAAEVTEKTEAAEKTEITEPSPALEAAE